MKKLILFIVSGMLLLSSGAKAEKIIKLTCDLYWTNNTFLASKTIEMETNEFDISTKDYLEWTEISKPTGKGWAVAIYNVNRNTGKGFYKLSYITEEEKSKFLESNKKGSEFGFKFANINTMNCFKTPDKKF